MLRYYQPDSDVALHFYHRGDGKSSFIVQYHNKSHNLVKNIKCRRQEHFKQSRVIVGYKQALLTCVHYKTLFFCCLISHALRHH